MSLLYCVDKRTVYCHDGTPKVRAGIIPNSQPSTSSCHVSQILSVMNSTIKDGIPWGEIFCFLNVFSFQLESHPYSPLPPVLGFINIYPSIHVKYQQNVKLVIFNCKVFFEVMFDLWSVFESDYIFMPNIKWFHWRVSEMLNSNVRNHFL